MFLRRTRGLKDLLLATLCLWGACYHTPIGAAFRGVVGFTIGHKTSLVSVLSYYNGGVYTPEVFGREMSLPQYAIHTPVAEADALGYGIHSVWMRLAERQRERSRLLAPLAGIPPGSLDDTRDGPRKFARLVRHLSGELGSDEAAVVALLCGIEPARYAVDRLRAEGGPVELERLARQLPPGFAEEMASASEALMLGAAFSLAWPAPLVAPITSPFGPRLHPVLGQEKMHEGVDIYIREGTPVTAAGDGVVSQAGQDSFNGNFLTLDHGRGVTTAYCHNSKLRVRAGQWVKKGDIIAESGRSGRATGPHLHYQLELARVPVDPLRFRAPLDAVAKEMGTPVATPVLLPVHPKPLSVPSRALPATALKPASKTVLRAPRTTPDAGLRASPKAGPRHRRPVKPTGLVAKTKRAALKRTVR